MTVSLSQHIDPKRLTVALLSNENLSAVQQALAAIPGLAIATTDAEKDKELRYQTPEHKVVLMGIGETAKYTAEDLRRAIHKAVALANSLKSDSLQLVATGLAAHAEAATMALALGEMPVLANYQFLQHRTKDVDKQRNTLSKVEVVTDLPNRLDEGRMLAEATCHARNMVNEPPNILNSLEIAHRAKELGEAVGIKVEVLGKAQIESLKMGGLLAVNRGSHDEPTFTIMEYKPANAKNSKPYVIVGKGIVFDTGGLSLKPTPGSMDSMKCDMAGGATAICTILAAAYNKLPLYIVALIPATDNRPGYNAYTPNDVVTMMNGSTVEVLNTDAEGRMILADALHFAKRYNPELVVDLATLTGAAVIAVGSATAMMTTADRSVAEQLVQSGHRTYERLVELPLWKEYADGLKSDVADMKNVAGRGAGSITAGKFLETFTEGYPWVHLDIAGSAYLEAAQGWMPKNATGVGVRLLYDFLASKA